VLDPYAGIGSTGWSRWSRGGSRWLRTQGSYHKLAVRNLARLHAKRETNQMEMFEDESVEVAA